MPLGIVSDEDWNKEVNIIHKPMAEKGRGNGNGAVPMEIREIIAEEAIVNGNTTKIAETFGVSKSSVDAYKNGATSTATYNEPNERLQKRNDKVRTEIISSAKERLLAALQHITPEKLKDAKLRDVSSVAKDMASVISATEPQVSNTNIGAQFIYHIPQQKKESDFDVIDVTGA